jgi:hypothetical protein
VGGGPVSDNHFSGCFYLAMAKDIVLPTAGFEFEQERKALGRFTSASPYSSIKVSNTSLDHLLLGKAADGKIIRLFFAAAQICAQE